LRQSWNDSDVLGKSRLILFIVVLGCVLGGGAWLFATASACALPAALGLTAGLVLAYLIGIGAIADAGPGDRGGTAHAVLSALPDAVVRLDNQGHPEYLNPAAETMLGLSNGEIDGGWRLIDHATRVDQLAHLLARADKDGPTRIPDGSRLVSRNGLESEVEGSCQALRADGGRIEGYLLQLHDVTEEREWRRQQPDMWDRDIVSALPGRNFMEQRLDQALQNKRASDLPLSYLRIELSGIGEVYDKAGETAGDTLVRHLAALLRAHVRDTDLIARIDEHAFGILLTHCPPEISQRITAGVLSGLDDFSFKWQGQSHAIEYRLGRADAPPFDGSLDELLAAASPV
jgi:diguanylate cyclase (GGDEF)-like protein/PAS domain S-box-containing protein